MVVTLHPYRDDLPILFQKEKERIIGFIPYIKDIHHVGSSTYLSTKLHNATEGDFHIHILRKGGQTYHDWLTFRNYLRSKKKEQKKYAELKLIWLNKSKGVGMAYAKLKTDYIKTVLKKAYRL